MEHLGRKFLKVFSLIQTPMWYLNPIYGTLALCPSIYNEDKELCISPAMLDSNGQKKPFLVLC